MRDPYKTHENHDYPNPQLDPVWVFRMRILGFSVLGILVIRFFSGYIREDKDFWTVFIGGSLTWMILMAMAFQIKIADRQAKISDQQQSEMSKQRKIMEDSFRQTRRAIRHNEEAMRDQWQAMVGGLERTDELLKQNVRMLEEVEKQARAAETQNVLTEQSLELARLSAQITKDQLQLARLTQRPDIDLVLTFEPLGIDSRIPMLFKCLNVGIGAAYKFGMQVSAKFTEVDYDGVLEYGKPKPFEAEPIRNGAPNFIHPEPILAQPYQVMPMLSGNNWLIVFGIYWYYDGAGNRYEEIFCRRFNHLDPLDAVQCEGSLRAKIVEETESA
jgi:hypothetical protein